MKNLCKYWLSLIITNRGFISRLVVVDLIRSMEAELLLVWTDSEKISRSGSRFLTGRLPRGSRMHLDSFFTRRGFPSTNTTLFNKAAVTFPPSKLYDFWNIIRSWICFSFISKSASNVILSSHFLVESKIVGAFVPSDARRN